MGMFDTVMIACPRCGHDNGFQSKGGACTGGVYKGAKAPWAVLEGLQDELCHRCGVPIKVKLIKHGPGRYEIKLESEEKEETVDEESFSCITHLIYVWAVNNGVSEHEIIERLVDHANRTHFNPGKEIEE